MAATFVPFGPDHLVVLALTAAGAACLILSRRRLREGRDRMRRHLLAAILGTSGLLGLAADVVQGRPPLPLQLCDLALLAAIWALVRPTPPVAELAYFWALTGSVQAVLTPDLHVGFPHFWWWSFFINHCGVVLGAVYLAVTGRVQPTRRSVWRMWIVTNVYAGAAGLVNWGWGTNFGYLAHKPSQPSLLDYFGPWPVYILTMEVVALGIFVLCYAPFALARRTGNAQRFRSQKSEDRGQRTEDR